MVENEAYLRNMIPSIGKWKGKACNKNYLISNNFPPCVILQLYWWSCCSVTWWHLFIAWNVGFLISYINTSPSQCIINTGALPCLLSLLTHNHKKSIKKEACWTISNITAGNKEQIQVSMHHLEVHVLGYFLFEFVNPPRSILDSSSWGSTIFCRICLFCFFVSTCDLNSLCLRLKAPFPSEFLPYYVNYVGSYWGWFNWPSR